MPRPQPQHEKKCPMCSVTKMLDEFYPRHKHPGLFLPYCKPCYVVRNRNGRKPDRALEYAKRRYAESDAVREKAKAQARAGKERAKQNPAQYRAQKFFDVRREGVAPDITKEYIAELFAAATHCECCGKVLQIEFQPAEKRRHRTNPDGPSVDRVNNDEGYTKANIAIICWECNFRKTDLTLTDLAMLEKYIRRFAGV